MKTIFLYLRALVLLLFFAYLVAFGVCAAFFFFLNSDMSHSVWQWQQMWQLTSIAVLLAAGSIAYFYIWSLDKWRRGDRNLRSYITVGAVCIALGTIYTAFSPLIWALYIISGFLMSAGFIMSFSWVENFLERRK